MRSVKRESTINIETVQYSESRAGLISAYKLCIIQISGNQTMDILHEIEIKKTFENILNKIIGIFNFITY